MKKLLLLTAILMMIGNSAYAGNVNNNPYCDKSIFFTASVFPQSVANDINKEKPENLQNLKMGIATTTNFLGLVQVGDSSIEKAAKQGGITKIHYAETATSKVYIPVIFVPIYAKTTATKVYGE